MPEVAHTRPNESYDAHTNRPRVDLKLVEWYLKASEVNWTEAETLNINTLQKIYELRGNI